MKLLNAAMSSAGGPIFANGEPVSTRLGKIVTSVSATPYIATHPSTATNAAIWANTPALRC